MPTAAGPERRARRSPVRPLPPAAGPAADRPPLPVPASIAPPPRRSPVARRLAPAPEAGYTLLAQYRKIGMGYCSNA